MTQQINGININTSNGVDIQSLVPQLRALLAAFVTACAKQGLNIIVVQGFRSIDYQNGLFAIGRTKPGKIVTSCQGGQSPHNIGKAFDFAPLEKNGSINWNTGILNPKWGQCIKIAESIGLRSGKNFKVVDIDHLELPGASEEAFNTWSKTHQMAYSNK